MRRNRQRGGSGELRRQLSFKRARSSRRNKVPHQESRWDYRPQPGSRGNPPPQEKGSMIEEAKHKLDGEPSGSGAHILLFEDGETLSSLLARVLRSEGYQVDVFDDADAAPPPAKLARYDLVLSDVHLANNTNGHEVLRRVREASAAIPVILMTAYADIEGAMNAVGLGAYDYLGKPIEPTELNRMVSEAIARRKLAQAADSTPSPPGTAHGVAQILATTPPIFALSNPLPPLPPPH